MSSNLNLNDLKNSNFKPVPKTISLDEIGKEEQKETPKSQNPLPKKAQKTDSEIQAENLKTSKLNRRLFTVILLMLTCFSLAFIYVMGKRSAEDFYIGTWQSELIPQEDELGIESISYDVGLNSIVEVTKSNSDGVEAVIKVKSDLKVIEKDAILITSELSNSKIESIEVKIPMSLCSGNSEKCNELEQSYKDKLNQTISETIKETGTQTIKFRKLAQDQVQLEMPDGVKVLNKQ